MTVPTCKGQQRAPSDADACVLAARRASRSPRPCSGVRSPCPCSGVRRPCPCSGVRRPCPPQPSSCPAVLAATPWQAVGTLLGTPRRLGRPGCWARFGLGETDMVPAAPVRSSQTAAPLCGAGALSGSASLCSGAWGGTCFPHPRGKRCPCLPQLLLRVSVVPCAHSFTRMQTHTHAHTDTLTLTRTDSHSHADFKSQTPQLGFRDLHELCHRMPPGHLLSPAGSQECPGLQVRAHVPEELWFALGHPVHDDWAMREKQTRPHSQTRSPALC